MKALLQHLRLLPVVVVVGSSLLVVKGVDLARAAQAPLGGVMDNSGLAPPEPHATPAADLADDDESANASPSEVDVLTSLTRRRAELDARERALAMRENLLKAGEGRVDQKIGSLKTLQTDIQGLLVQRDAKQEAQIASLVKTYSAMKPRDAARIFNALSDDVLLPVAKGMKSDVLAPVMAAMNPDAAQKLTVKLAALLKLPESAATNACPPAPATDPAASAAATPSVAPAPPLQTAALAPPPVVTIPPAPGATVPPATPAAAPPMHKPAIHHETAPKPVASVVMPPPAAAAAMPAPVAPPKPVAAATPATTPSVLALTPAAPVSPAVSKPAPVPPTTPAQTASAIPPAPAAPTPPAAPTAPVAAPAPAPAAAAPATKPGG